MLHCGTKARPLPILPSPNPPSKALTTSSVTAGIGQQSILQSDWVIDVACENDPRYAIPENLRTHLLISRFIARVNRILSENDRSPTGQPFDSDICIILAMLEQDLASLERQLGHDLSGE
jgi:hypothetical protein